MSSGANYVATPLVSPPRRIVPNFSGSCDNLLTQDVIAITIIIIVHVVLHQSSVTDASIIF